MDLVAGRVHAGSDRLGGTKVADAVPSFAGETDLVMSPDTPEAGRSRRELDEMPQWAKDIPPLSGPGEELPPELAERIKADPRVSLTLIEGGDDIQAAGRLTLERVVIGRGDGQLRALEARTVKNVVCPCF